MDRSLRPRPLWSVRLAAAALIALAAHALAPQARAGEPESAAMCPAGAQRQRLAGTPAKIEEIQRRIAAQAKPGQKIVALSNSGYSYAPPLAGADGPVLQFEAEQLEAAPAPR